MAKGLGYIGDLTPTFVNPIDLLIVPSDCSSLISSSPPSLLHLLRKTSPLIRRPWSAALESKNANCLTTPYSAPAPHGQRSDKVRAPQLHSLVPYCTPPGLSPTSVRTRVRFLHCYEDTGIGRARSCSKQTCLCALLRIHVLFTQAIVTLITTRKRLTHLNVLVISWISSMSLMSLIVATVRAHREV